jgi:hypothetical protein
MTRIIKSLLWALCLILLASHVYSGPLESLMMPGKLIDGHKKYENDCENCHESFSKKKQTRLCRKCHEEIDKEISIQSGFHGRIRNINNIECKSCHTDHKGRDVDIIKLDKLAFDHNSTDFALKGKHRSVACHACHLPEKKYREAPSQCYSCHKNSDVHKGSLGKKCQQCHSQNNWLQARFDHDKTDFSLSGKHKDTDCNNCHINQQYKDTPGECHQCHITKDVHNGIFGKKCNSCHRSDKWDSSTFNHNKKTDFNLSGKHQQTSCESCHRENPYQHQTPSRCISCHKADDIHRGVFGKKCDACHSDNNWSKISFDHNRDTDFRLENRHKQTRCDNCHQQNPYTSKTIRTCYTCHRSDDIHKGSQGKQCQNCHNDKGWSDKVAFDHDLSSFPLIGLHASVACEDCHIDSNYSKTPDDCLSCHQQDDIHKELFGKKCNSCHNPNAWNRWQFDHKTETDFSLEGAHKDLECHACHLIDDAPRQADENCNSCHAIDDIHDGNFGIQCDRCHTQDSFSDIQISR